VNQLQGVAGIYELTETEQGTREDGYDEMRTEIHCLLATVKAMLALLPRPE